MLMRSRPGCLRSCSWRRRRTTRFLHNNNFAADNFKARSDLWNTAFPSVRTSYLVSYAQFYFILSKNKVSLENIFIQSIFLRILPTSSPSTRPSRPSWPPTPNGSNHCWPWVRISLTKRSAAAARRPSREVWWPTWPFFYTYEIFISCFISLSLSIYIFPFYLRLFSLSLSIYTYHLLLCLSLLLTLYHSPPLSILFYFHITFLWLLNWEAKLTLFLQNRLESIAEQWELLTQKTSEKSMKLKEANRQRTFIAAVKVSLIYVVCCTAYWKCNIKDVILLILLMYMCTQLCHGLFETQYFS